MSTPNPNECIVVASVSGGKDSTAMSLWLTEQGIEHRRVFADTGWEHPATIEYVNTYLPEIIGPIDTVRGVRTFEEEVLRKGMFPSRMRKWCTSELKLKPIFKYIDAASDDGEVINAVGIRRAESTARANMSEWEFNNNIDCWAWRPLVTWSEADVIDIHQRHGVRPNPLYLRGASRVGCWPCIHARKAEIRLVADIDPERIALIRRMEEDVNTIARAKFEARGETMRSARAMYQGADGGTVPIDDVVAWSRTARGGKQMLMFETGEPGCVRWGMCDTADDDS